ncbi:sensor histidine kinase [Nocardia thailandica]|uniref:sensor histidine kinase n=1 Tax=Nocardia thailandica TaxID=257275 RepID=UPI00030AB7A3|nr:ATP-binding protein [Nocardia thailandica]
MDVAHRSWQFSLSNWSVTRKVGVVLVLPVMLATVFAVLRINNELQTMSQLDAAAEQAAILRPVVKYTTATEQLAIAATTHWGNIADPQVDAALSTYDQALAELQSALRTSQTDAAVLAELNAAAATGTTLRGAVRSGSPAMLGTQADEITTRASNALALTPAVEDTDIQRYFTQLGSLQSARRLLAQQRMLVADPDPVRAQTVRSKVLVVLGAEASMIETYSHTLPGQAGAVQPLVDAVQTRLGVFSQNASDPSANPAVVNSLQVSDDTYNQTTETLIKTLETTVAERTADAQAAALRETTIVLGMLLAGLALALAVARTLVVPVRRLRRDALEVAHVKLPDELAVVRGGGATPEIAPVGIHSTDEIGQLARAVDEIHEQALNLAADQARLRLQIGNMFETLSRRSQSLVEQQLSLIEELEHDEDNPSRLQTLFRLDHLATRMRRNGDNLLVLAGTVLRRGHLPPVPLSDMLWSSVSQVEDYQRVEIGSVPDGVVAGESAVDIEHLLAELIDNALRYSPPSTPVAVTVGRAVDGGYLVEITDRGLGMSSQDLQSTNDSLASGGEVTVETARRMGLFVVGRLAKRHTVTVSLRRNSSSAQQPGITASVHLPGALVTPLPEPHHPPSGPLPVVPATVPTNGNGNGTAQHRAAFDPNTTVLTSAGLPQRRPAAPPAHITSTTTTALPVVTDPAVEAAPTGLWAEHPHEDEPVAEPAPARLLGPSGLPMRTPGASTPPAALAPEAEPLPAPEPDAVPDPAFDDPMPTSSTRLQPVTGPAPTPIYQRMVSEWLVEPSAAGSSEPPAWTTPVDPGWEAAESAGHPQTSSRTSGGLPIRKPGAQLVPGATSTTEESGQRDPEEIRNNLTRHLSGVRSGRAEIQYNDGGLE